VFTGITGISVFLLSLIYRFVTFSSVPRRNLGGLHHVSLEGCAVSCC